MSLRTYIFFTLTVLTVQFGLVNAQQASGDSITTSEINTNAISVVESEADREYRSGNFAESIKIYESQIVQHKLRASSFIKSR